MTLAQQAAIEAVLALVLVAPVMAQQEPSQNPTFPAPSWLKGSGDSLALQLKGAVLLANGVAAKDSKLSVLVMRRGHSEALDIVRDGNEFSVWIPLGKRSPFVVQVVCESADGKEVFAKTLEPYELRQTAMDGLEIRLRPVSRTLDFLVTEVDLKPPHKMTPLEGAMVRGATRDRPYFSITTNRDGRAQLKLQKDEVLEQTSAHTKNSSFGGQVILPGQRKGAPPDEVWIISKPFTRFPLRLVREDDHSPIANANIIVRYQSKVPPYNYMESFPEEITKTDAKGEATIETFPVWLAGTLGIDTGDLQLTNASLGKLVDGVYEIPMKRSHLAESKTCGGLVITDKGSPGGFCITMGTRQGEFGYHRLETQYAFTDADGQFSGNYLPGATYCILAHDLRQVSDIVTMIPNPSETGIAKTPLLSISEGAVVELKVARGEKKVPEPYVDVELETKHRMTWLDKNGVENAANGGRTWKQRADENGKLTIYA